MTTDIRRTIGLVAAITGFGLLVNAINIALTARAHGATPRQQVTHDYDNDGRQFARVAPAKRAHQARRAGRMDRVAAYRVRDRALPMAISLRVEDPRPRAWCGWYMRQKLGLRDRALNLARNWARIGRAARPAPGVIVVWHRHVGRIIAVTGPGRAIVESGNDGGVVRVRERSIANAIAFREV